MSIVANREQAEVFDAINARIDCDNSRIFIVKNVDKCPVLFAKYLEAIEYVEDSNKYEFFTNISYTDRTIHCFIEKGLAHKLHCSKWHVFYKRYQEEKHCPQIVVVMAKTFLNDRDII